MKKKLWIYILISICLIIGIYFLVANNQNEGLRRVDNIPDLSPTNTASTEGNSVINVSQNENGQEVPDKETNNTQQATEEPAKNEPLVPSTGNVPGNTMSNFSGGGVLATDGEWEYASVSKAAFMDKFLYKISTDGTESIRLINHNLGYINIIEDWIFYIKWNDEYKSDGIFRLKKDSSKEEQLFSGDSRDMIIIGEMIYFINASDDNKIYSMKTDGNDIKVFYDMKVSRMQYDNDCLFFVSKGYLYRLCILDNKLDELAQNVWKYIIYNNSAYYQEYDDSRLYKKNIGESEIKIINNKVNTEFFVGNDKIYFMTGISENENIYTMDLEGKDVEVFYNGGIENPVRSIYGVVGDTVYYWIIRDAYGSGDDELARINSDGSITLMSEIIKD